MGNDMTLRANVVGGIVSSMLAAALLVNCVGDDPATATGLEDDGSTGDASPDQTTPNDGASPSDAGPDTGPGCVPPSSSRPGALDGTYGNSLKNVSNFSSPEAAAVDALGRVYVAGVGNCTSVSNSDLAVMRFDATGGVDTTFNGGSAVKCFDLDKIEHAYAIAIDDDGKILVGGISGHTTPSTKFFASVVRFDDHATLDNGFGNGGMLNVIGPDAGGTPAGGQLIVVYGMAIVPNGNKIVLVGGDDNGGGGGSQHGFIVRLAHDGNLDIGFGNNGLYTDTTNTLYFNAAIDDAGGVSAPSRQQFSSLNQFIVTKLDSDGHLVNGFGTNGFASIPALGSGGDEAHVVLQMPGGSLLVAGGRDMALGSQGTGAVAVFGPNGTLDQTFGDAGVRDLPLIYNNIYESNGVVRTCSGDLFVAEQRNDGTAGFTDAAAQDTALMHLSANGTIDTSYGEGGVARAFFNGGDIPVAALLDPLTKKILVVSRDNAGRVGIFRFEP